MPVLPASPRLRQADEPAAGARAPAGVRGVRPTVAIVPGPCDLADADRRFFNPGELAMLVHLVRSVSPRVVVEFGCNEGRGARALLRNVPCIERYVGIDVLPGYRTIQPCQRNEVPTMPGRLARDDRRFELLLCARGSFDLSARDLPVCDAAFIDADHSRQGVLNDFVLAKAIVRPGGIVIFHDDNDSPKVEVTQTLDELHSQGEEITRVAGTWFAYWRAQ